MATINIMVLRHAAFYSPLLATMSGGFLKKQGLEANYQVASANNSVDMGITAGTVDVAQSAVATSFHYLEANKRPPYVHFAQINERDGFFLTGRKAEPRFNWQDLKGKNVIVDHFFQPKAMFNYALHLQGLSLDDINVIDAGNVAEIDQAFRDGQGDYVHQQGPAAQQLENDHKGYVVASVGEVIGPVAFSSLCASADWLRSDMAQSFIHAYKEARQHVISSPASELAKELQYFFPETDNVVLESTINYYQQLGCWSPSITISPSSYEKVLDIFQYNNLIKTRYPYQDVCLSLT